MSDYLWDKTGEPEREVERLEELLGALKHQPRPLELPSDVRVEQPRHRLRPALAAAAAVVALIMLAGAWLASTRGDGDAEQKIAVKPQHEAPQREATPTVNNAGTVTVPEQPDEQVVRNDEREEKTFRRQAPRVGAVNKRRGSTSLTKTPPAARREDAVAREPLDEHRRVDDMASISPEQREAKEQLMYALRLTSAKLNEVQRRTRDASDERPAASPERNKIR